MTAPAANGDEPDTNDVGGSVDGAGVWSHEVGEGPLLALVHGSMDRSAGLLRLSRRLDERCRVLRYDRRGYGRSVGHPGPFDMEGQIADLETLLAGRRAVVFGHSYGGNVALGLADRHPHLVEAVVVYESPLSWYPWWPGTTAGGDALATRGDPDDAAERFMRRLIGDDRWEKMPPSNRAARRAEGAAMVGELTDLRQRPPWAPERITVPVTTVHGEKGAPHHRDAMRFLADLLPGAQNVEIAGARHFGPNTHADAVAEVIERVLDGVSAG